jgi:uroporphyrinogen-III synthase
MGEELRRAGVETSGHPLLRETPPSDRSALDRASASLEAFDFIAFTSPRGVRALAREVGVEASGQMALAVGPATADAASRAGFHLAAVADDPRAAGLLDALDTSGVEISGCRVLLPVSERARPDLEQGLTDRGAEVAVVPAYTVRTVEDPGTVVRAIAGDGADAALVASPSAVKALVDGGALVADGLPPLLAIGPTTREAMDLAGLRPAATADRPDAQSVRRAAGSLAEQEEE